MTLPASAPRKLIHTRTVECCGYEREDGLWDIEGHITDVKTHDVVHDDRGGVRAGRPIHDMWIRLSMDLDMKIHGVEARTVHSPYHTCGEIVRNYQVLIGETIKAGWTQRTRQLLGGTKGCTHLLELLGPVATTAFQTLYAAREKRRPTGADGIRPPLIDTCHAWSAEGPMVMRRFPAFAASAKKSA
jgi:hypothetical protein